MIKALPFLLFILCVPAAALAAGKSGADACASKLEPDAKQIYASVAPEVTPSSDIKSLITDKVKPLVMSGKMTRDAAHEAAVSAGDCLKLLK